MTEPLGWLTSLRRRWERLSLAWQFCLAGGLVSIGAMVAVGLWITHQIEDSVTRNAAATTALYVDSVISPLLPDMQKSQSLDESVAKALDETLSQGALGRRLLSFRLWRVDGTVLYANDKSLIGRRFPLSQDLRAALRGQVIAEFDKVNDPESESERASGLPLLEIYNPVLQPWSGEVVAVSEFYEIARDLEADLRAARLRSWLAVGAATGLFFAVLSAIVFRGSRTIDAHRAALARQISELSDLLDQNQVLRLRVQGASERIATLNEHHMRRIGADLHDGPAQLVAFAALRLESPAFTDPDAPPEKREREIRSVKTSLDDALAEIRYICNGLVLPRIESADLPDILSQAVRAHEKRSRESVALALSGTSTELSTPEKICVYRFVQEALSNGTRHAPGAALTVRETMEDGLLVIAVEDDGPGFDQAVVRADGLGLAGLRERVESLGGSFAVATSETGTTVSMSLPREQWQR